jgi:acylglycerol lipase
LKTENGKFVGHAGIEIFWQAWLPDTIRCAVIISHGLGEHSGRYKELAQEFGKADFAVFALDHRGHGQSEGKRGHIMAFDEYLTDLDTFRRKVEERFSDLPRFLLGHSMGGLIASHYAIQFGAGLTGLILSSPGLRMGFDPPAIKLAAGRVMSKILPGLSLANGLDPNAVSRDKKVVEEYLADPLVHDRISARWGTEYIDKAMPAVHEKAHEITIPVLIMQSGDDQLVGPQGAQEFYDRLTTEDKTVKFWDGFYHEMFNEIPEDRAKAVQFTIDWIEKHLD